MYIKIKTFFYFDSISRRYWRKLKNTNFSTHKILKKIVVPDQGENWRRHRWKPYEKTDISFSAQFATHQAHEDISPKHDFHTNTSNYHHVLFFCDATFKFASFDLKNEPRIRTTYANKRKASPFFLETGYGPVSIFPDLCNGIIS